MKTYSSTFAAELVAAGVGGLPMTWDKDGNFQFDDSITQAQRDTILAVAAVNKPDNPRITEIKRRLADIDTESIRALRSKSVGRGRPQDDLKLNTLDSECDTLRAELAAL